MNPVSRLLYHGQISYVRSVSVYWWDIPHRVVGRTLQNISKALLDGFLRATDFNPQVCGLVVDRVFMATVVMKTDTAYWK